MENGLIGYLELAVGLRVSHNSETHLAAQVAKRVCEFTGVELPTVIKNDGARNAKVGDNVSPNEPSYFSGGYRGYNLDLYPFGEVVNYHKKVLALPRSLGERAKDIHTPCSER